MNIKEQILESVGTLEMRAKIIDKPECHRDMMSQFLTIKEVLKIPADKKEDIFNWTPSVLFSEYEEFYHGLSSDTESDEYYDDITDAYGLCELFTNSKRLRVIPDYLKYIKSSTDGYIINIYNTGAADIISNNIWNLMTHQKAREKFNNGEVSACEFMVPDSVKHFTFRETKYWDSLLVECCRNDLAVLAIDLPFEYYSKQILPGNIFTWDIIEQKYQVVNMDINIVNNRINDVAENGFNEPLVMRINEGCLTPVDDQTNMDLFIASYLGIPTIPCVLFMSNEEVLKNHTMEELHEIVHSNLWKDPAALNMINSICKPYFYFENVVESKTKSFLQVADTYMNKNQYPVMNNISDTTVAVYDRYLDTSVPEQEVNIPLSKEELEKKMQSSVNELLDKAVQEDCKRNDEIIKKILNGEY